MRVFYYKSINHLNGFGKVILKRDFEDFFIIYGIIYTILT